MTHFAHFYLKNPHNQQRQPFATLAMLAGLNGELYLGVAVCGKGDQFSRITGRQIALGRAHAVFHGRDCAFGGKVEKDNVEAFIEILKTFKQVELNFPSMKTSRAIGEQLLFCLLDCNSGLNDVGGDPIALLDVLGFILPDPVINETTETTETFEAIKTTETLDNAKTNMASSMA